MVGVGKGTELAWVWWHLTLSGCRDLPSQLPASPCPVLSEVGTSSASRTMVRARVWCLGAARRHPLLWACSPKTQGEMGPYTALCFLAASQTLVTSAELRMAPTLKGAGRWWRASGQDIPTSRPQCILGRAPRVSGVRCSLGAQSLGTQHAA